MLVMFTVTLSKNWVSCRDREAVIVNALAAVEALVLKPVHVVF